jgi:hypothetical protein
MIREYWLNHGTKVHYSNVRGTLENNGKFYEEGNPVPFMLDYELGWNIFETEAECIESMIKQKKDKLETIRLEIDELEVRLGKVRWPEKIKQVA